MKISVCLATYNGEKFIHSQLESILHQLAPTDEVIVSDDGSTDQTIATIESLQDSRIIVLNHAPATANTAHVRISKNFENALRSATGDLIFLSDQDDLWQPDKIATIRAALKSNQLVCSNALLTGSEGIAIQKTFYEETSPLTGLLSKLIKVNYHGCTMAFRRELLEAALPFPESLPIHDGWLGMIAELTGTVCYIPSALTKYRLHTNNTSKVENSFLYKLSYRYYVFKELYKRYKSIDPNASLPRFIKLLNKPKTNL